jgi:hypothetical protein
MASPDLSADPPGSGSRGADLPGADLPGPWISLWVTALVSLFAQLALCRFFSFGQEVPVSIDVDPSNLWKYAYQFPPGGEFLTLNWLGVANLPPPLNPFSLAANLPAWWFFTTYTPVIGTLALLAMAAFLRELELPRPAAIFGGLIFAWQGDLLPFVFPGHYGYIATWPCFALAAWGALRSSRTGRWAYALISGASCGVMVGLQPDRGAIASLLIAALFIAGAWSAPGSWFRRLRSLALCAASALVISLAAFLALFQSNINGVTMGGQTNPAEIYKFDTQFSLGPEESLTYLVPGFFGWHSNHPDGPYWGRIGQSPDWPKHHQGSRNLNLAISTTGTVATVLALLAAVLLLSGDKTGWLGENNLTPRQRHYGRVLLGLGAAALVLAWGYHTPFYQALFAVPLMDKWRDPLKWLEMTNFALVTLSALGVQHLFVSLTAAPTDETRSNRRRLLWFLDGILVVLFLGLLASYPFTISLAATLPAAGYEPQAVAGIMSTLHTALALATALMMGMCVMLRLLWRPEFLRRWQPENPWIHRAWQAMMQPKHLPLTLALGLGLLGAGQLAWVATQFIQPTSLADLTATNPLLEALRSEGPKVRVSVTSDDPVLNVLLQNQFNSFRISCLEVSAASRIPDAVQTFFGAFNNDPTRLWLLAGVKNLVVPEDEFAGLERDPRIAADILNVDGYTLETPSAPNLPSHALIKLKDHLAKATFVPDAEILPDAAMLERLKNPNWDPRATVLLASAPAKTEAVAGPATATALHPDIDVDPYTPHRIDIAVQTPRSGYVLINDAYDPDWEATLNGRAVPLLRADYLLRAVAVPAGVSSVVLDYVAHYRMAGLDLPVEATNLFCDAAMLAAWVVAGVALWRRRGMDGAR